MSVEADVLAAQMLTFAQASERWDDQFVSELAHRTEHLAPKPFTSPSAMRDKEGCHIVQKYRVVLVNVF